MKLKQAFTLIELLVVIAIIGILSGLIVVSMSGVTEKASVAKAQVFSNSLRNSLMLDLVSEYKFDELTTVSTGAVIEDSWGDNNGSVYAPYGGAPSMIIKEGSDCVAGKCIDMTVSAYENLSRISVPSIDLPSGYLTVSFWAYYRGGVRYNGGVLTSNGAGSFIISNQSSQYVCYASLRGAYTGFYFYFTDNSYIGSSFYFSEDITNKWKLITFIYDGSNLRFFEDGKEVTPIAKTGLLRSSLNSSMMIGGFTTYWLNGRIDDFRIYNSAISSFQIKEQYYSGLNSLLSSGSIAFSEYLERIDSLAKF